MARALPVRADFCNVASGWEKGLVEKNVQDSRRRIWQDAAARALRQLRRAQCLAGDAVPGAVGGAAIRSTRGVTIARRGAGAAAADADAHAVRRLRGGPGPRVEHLPGERGAQPLLGAVRAGPASGQRAAVSRRGSSSSPISAIVAEHARAVRSRPRRLRLAALPAAGRAQARAPCATARRSPTCPSRCSGCAARCCATRAATG